MPASLTERFIADRLRAAYTPGLIAGSDGGAHLYAGCQLKCAAVLVPLAQRDGEWHLVFTRRAETVEHHKGQVSFPGGGCDGGESTPEETALREAREEIGLARTDVRLLGRLNDFVTITCYRVTPVVGVMPWPYPLRPEPAEVGRVFTIPLGWLAEKGHWSEAPFTPGGETRPFPVVTYQVYDGEILWGASARMTLNLLGVLGLCDFPPAV